MKFISFHFICQKDKKINIRLKAFWENENWFYNLNPIYDDDDELFLWNGWLTKGVKHYFQLTPLSDSHHHKSPTYHRIWDCAEPQFRLCWRKLCSSDNHFTRVPQQCVFTIILFNTTLLCSTANKYSSAGHHEQKNKKTTSQIKFLAVTIKLILRLSLCKWI